MQGTRKGFALGAAFLLAFCGGGCGWSGRRSALAPDFALKTLSGETIRLGDFRGQTVLLDFWATWCAPCTDSIPFYQKLYERHRSPKFTVVGIDEDGLPDIVRPFAQKNDMTYPILLDSENRTLHAYDINKLPTTLLVDGEGKILRRWADFDAGVASDVEKAVTAIAAPEPPK